MELSPNPAFGEAAGALMELLETSGAIHPETYFANFDTIWVNPEHRKTLVSVIEMSLALVAGRLEPSRTVLLSPDNLRRPFGLIPAIACVAEKLGTYIAVWKEAAAFTTGLGSLYGPANVPLDCFVFQDAIAGGSTILKMAPALSKSTWNIRAYVCLLLARPENTRVRRNLEELAQAVKSTPDDIVFHYVTKWSR
jgi:hypothetical protein